MSDVQKVETSEIEGADGGFNDRRRYASVEQVLLRALPAATTIRPSDWWNCASPTS